MKLNVRNTNVFCMPFFFAMEASLLNIKNHVISKRKKISNPRFECPVSSEFLPF